MSGSFVTDSSVVFRRKSGLQLSKPLGDKPWDYRFYCEISLPKQSAPSSDRTPLHTCFLASCPPLLWFYGAAAWRQTLKCNPTDSTIFTSKATCTTAPECVPVYKVCSQCLRQAQKHKPRPRHNYKHPRLCLADSLSTLPAHRLTSTSSLISMSSVCPTVCLLSFLQVRENVNNAGVRSEPIDEGGEERRAVRAPQRSTWQRLFWDSFERVSKCQWRILIYV